MSGPSSTSSKPLVVGLSGVSSSGKTTLAHILRDIWPKSFILHEDDMYLPDSQIPVKNGIQDWDCLEAIDLVKFRKTLQHIHVHGALPNDLNPKEDENITVPKGVDYFVIFECRERAKELIGDHSGPIFFVDGFLLYAQSMKDVWSQFDLKLFLRADFEDVKARREARTGYVTLEGFWKDPPGYVEDIVWPNYVRDHSFLFENGDVKGIIDSEVCRALDIEAVSGSAEGDMTDCVEWACKLIEAKFQAR
ncbi:MAG: ribosylnicotinamide kinase [Alyxoria varia]|nr:MAG: ribosylnicotinamide kinase [Alyxoria varia]